MPLHSVLQDVSQKLATGGLSRESAGPMTGTRPTDKPLHARLCFSPIFSLWSRVGCNEHVLWFKRVIVVVLQSWKKPGLFEERLGKITGDVPNLVLEPLTDLEGASASGLQRYFERLSHSYYTSLLRKLM